MLGLIYARTCTYMYTHTCTCMFNRTVDVRTRVKCLVGLDLRREPLYRR